MRVPTDQTLAKYGLTLQDWEALLTKDRKGVPICPICVEPLNKSVIDHKHVPRWSSFPPEVRKQYVRGVCCIRLGVDSFRKRNQA
jgi:hypothetical protein